MGLGRAKVSITASLRAKVDPDLIANAIVDIAMNPRSAIRERLQALAMICDRLDGKPIARSLVVSSDIDGSRLLLMQPSERIAYITQVKAQRLLGSGEATISEDESAISDDEHEDENK